MTQTQFNALFAFLLFAIFETLEYFERTEFISRYAFILVLTGYFVGQYSTRFKKADSK